MSTLGYLKPLVTQPDALSQTKLVKNRIAQHQGSSTTPIFETVAALAKGTEILAHEVTLLSAELGTLRQANEALSKVGGLKRLGSVKERHL